MTECHYHYQVVQRGGLSLWLSTIVLAGDLTNLVIVLGGDLGNLGIVLASNLNLNSCLFYYWQTVQVGNNHFNPPIVWMELVIALAIADGTSAS